MKRKYFQGMLVLGAGLVLAACATTQPHHRFSGKPITDLSEWESCAKEVCYARWGYPRQYGGNPPAPCIGNSPLQYDTTSYCGYKPDPKEITTAMQANFDRECLTLHGSQDNPDYVELREYDPNGSFMKYVRENCVRVKAETQARIEAQKAKDRAEQEERDKIDIRIGSPEVDVYRKFGAPRHVNSNVGPWGIHEQLVYGHLYIYIKDGRVESWQTHY